MCKEIDPWASLHPQPPTAEGEQGWFTLQQGNEQVICYVTLLYKMIKGSVHQEAMPF